MAAQKPKNMKKILILFAIALSTFQAYAQPSHGEVTSATNGKVVLPDNSVVEGVVQDNIRKKGEITIVIDGKKTKYKAGDINRASVGEYSFITWNYTFYEVIYQGRNLTLLRKANEPASVQYSGSDAVVVSSEGKVDDLFIKKGTNQAPELVSGKKLKEILTSTCPSCVAALDTTSPDQQAIRKAVELCDNCL